MAVSRRLRYEVLRRDEFTCRYCGAKPPEIELVVDHVVPSSLGGPDAPENLVTACIPCNTGKASVAPDSPIVAEVEVRYRMWLWALNELAIEASSNASLRETDFDDFEEAWGRWTPVAPLPFAWRGTVGRWLDIGYQSWGFGEAIRISMENGRVPRSKKWAYFCGVMWRKIDELGRQADQQVHDGLVRSGLDQAF